MTNYELLMSSNVRAELAKRNYLDFVKYVKPDYDSNWHHELLCSYLEKWINGDIKRLMVFMPPQHGKSELVSRNLPAYILGKNPRSKIVLASYSSDLSSTFNRDCQRIIDSNEYVDIFPETKLNSSNVVSTSKNWLRNSEKFEVVGHGGFLKTTGVGGSLTGTPADYAIIDDPVKDSVEAMSATFQNRNWNWYNDVLYTRIHNDTKILITQTRWDVNDLSGMLLKKMEENGEKWTVLCLPAIKLNNDNLDDPREIGDPLWGKRHDLDKLNMVRNQSIRTFQSLYQQDPKPVMAGGEFYHCFNPSIHIDVCKYNQELPIHATFDFNTSPYMTCCVWQINGKKATQIGEICTKQPRNNTKSLCAEFKRIYQGHSTGLFVYGDPAGRHEDTRSEIGFNDFSIIQSELKEFRPSMRIQSKAPSVVMRSNFINTILQNGYLDITLRIDNKCENTINDYLYLKQDSDGTKLKSKGKDINTGVTFEKYGHTSDANDYFICTAFLNEYNQYIRGGKSTSISLGRSTSKSGY